MKKKETRFKEKIQEKLKKIPGLWYAKVQNVSVRGIPDLIICFKGKFIAWELKTDQGEPDALQSYTLSNIIKASGIARVVSPKNVRIAFEEDLEEEY